MELKLDLSLFPEKEKLLVGVSGGRDSVALAHALHHYGVSIGIAHVNYGLRGEDSDADEALVRRLAKSLQVPCYVHRADTRMVKSGNIQINARKIRYDFFKMCLRECQYDHIATAHHREDRLESLLLNLMRGTGIYGLRGMPISGDDIVRPMLDIPRSMIDRYVAENALEYRDDLSNDEDDYARNRMRHHLLPLLDEIIPNASARLVASADMLEADARAVADVAAAFVQSSDDGILHIDRSALPVESGATWLYHCLRPFGFNRHQAGQLYASQRIGSLSQSGSHIVAVTRVGYDISRQMVTPERTLPVESPGVYEAGIWRLVVSVERESEGKSSAFELRLNSEDFVFPFAFRPWKDGDKINPISGHGTRSVSRYLTDNKVGAVRKRNVYVLCDAEENILWIPGYAVDKRTNTGNPSRWCVVFRIQSGAETGL